MLSFTGFLNFYIFVSSSNIAIGTSTKDSTTGNDYILVVVLSWL